MAAQSVIDIICDDDSSDAVSERIDVTPSRPGATSQAADRSRLTPSFLLSSTGEYSQSGSSTLSSGSSASGIVSLRRPTASEISRKRKICCNPPKGKKRSTGPGRSHPNSVTPHQRLKKFPNETFTVSNGKLFLFIMPRRDFNEKFYH